MAAAVGLGLAALGVALLWLAANPSPAAAQTGGATAPGSEPVGPPGKARLVNGRAIPPSNAPARVRRAIRAANRIRRKPYVWGGGHRRWNDRGYDCSGAVSYVLRAAGVLRRPLSSGPFMRWGRRGYGRWITVFANRGHMYAVIAGLRWDTSGPGQRGPRWRAKPRSPRRFAIRRHPRL